MSHDKTRDDTTVGDKKGRQHQARTSSGVFVLESGCDVVIQIKKLGVTTRLLFPRHGRGGGCWDDVYVLQVKEKEMEWVRKQTKTLMVISRRCEGNCLLIKR